MSYQSGRPTQGGACCIDWIVSFEISIRSAVSKHRRPIGSSSTCARQHHLMPLAIHWRHCCRHAVLGKKQSMEPASSLRMFLSTLYTHRRQVSPGNAMQCKGPVLATSGALTSWTVGKRWTCGMSAACLLPFCSSVLKPSRAKSLHLSMMQHPCRKDSIPGTCLLHADCRFGLQVPGHNITCLTIFLAKSCQLKYLVHSPNSCDLPMASHLSVSSS